MFLDYPRVFVILLVLVFPGLEEGFLEFCQNLYQHGTCHPLVQRASLDEMEDQDCMASDDPFCLTAINPKESKLVYVVH